MCRVNADVIRFIPQNIKIVFFHFYFLNQDFFLTIISITLLFGDLVDHLEGTRNFDVSPSFHLSNISREVKTVYFTMVLRNYP